MIFFIVISHHLKELCSRGSDLPQRVIDTYLFMTQTHYPLRPKISVYNAGHVNRVLDMMIGRYCVLNHT